MRRMQRIILLATFVAVVPVLSGCANFDPESLDIFGLGEKKKLPGDRRPVFPEGVPGVTQGVPPQYIKGSQPPADAALGADQVAPPAAAPVEEPKPVKPKAKRKVAAKPKPKPAAATLRFAFGRRAGPAGVAGAAAGKSAARVGSRAWQQRGLAGAAAIGHFPALIFLSFRDGSNEPDPESRYTV
jgi:hypothetical protein